MDVFSVGTFYVSNRCVHVCHDGSICGIPCRVGKKSCVDHTCVKCGNVTEPGYRDVCKTCLPRDSDVKMSLALVPIPSVILCRRHIVYHTFMY